MSNSSIQRKLAVMFALGLIGSSAAYAAEEAAVSLDAAAVGNAAVGGPGGGHGGGGGGGNHGGGGGGGNHGGGGGGGHGGGNPGGHGGGNPGGHGGGNPGGHGGGNPGGHGGGNPGGHGGGNPGGHGGGNPGGHGGGNPGGHGGGNPGGHGGGNPGGHGGHTDHGGNMGHDHHGNTVTHDHDQRVKDVSRRGGDYSKNNRGYKDSVGRNSRDYRNGGRRDRAMHRDHDYRGYYGRWHDYYRPWWNHGFRGGFYWGYTPYWDMYNYFWNPCIFWFYNSYDSVIYQTWYGDDYDKYPELKIPFKRSGVFLPTEEFRDLAIDMSGLDVQTQVNFRSTMEILADRLDEQLVIRGGGTLHENDLVINHYQTLPYDAGVVVEGVVASNNVQFAYKALLDLYNPAGSIVFAPSQPTDGNVPPAEQAQLDALNQRILELGGVVEGGAN